MICCPMHKVLFGNARKWLLFLTLLFTSLFGSGVFAQTKQEILDYMAEHQLHLTQVGPALGLSWGEVTDAFGFSRYVLDPVVDRASIVLAKCININVYLDSELEQLDRASLTQFAELRHMNDLSFVPICDNWNSSGAMNFAFEISTVGQSYPVAYLVRGAARFGGIEMRIHQPFELVLIGYSDANQVKRVVEETIGDMTRELALVFLEFR